MKEISLSGLFGTAGGLQGFLSIDKAYFEEDEDRLSLRMPLSEKALNHHGTAHGAAIYALCDIAAGAYMRIHGLSAVTLSSSIQYCSQGRPGTDLIATISLRKGGRQVYSLLAEVDDSDGNHIADAIFGMFLRRS